MVKYSFVIPCYRSEKTIESVVDEIIQKMKEMNINQYEIILINDSSPDNTFEVIRKLCSENKNIIGVNHSKNFGQHAALLDGFHYASGEVIICLDDDGQTPANEVDKLLAKIEEGYDVVFAKYEHKQHSLFRNIGSKANSIMTEIMLNKPKEIYLSSYFAVRKFVVDEMIKYTGAYPYLAGLLLRSTNNMCNVNVNHRKRQLGESGYSTKKLIALWVNGFTAFSVLPLRVASFIGGTIATIGFVSAIIVIIRKLLTPTLAMGWSSTISVILILGGLILLVLGIMGEYIGRIYILLNQSPQYVVKSVINYKE